MSVNEGYQVVVTPYDAMMLSTFHKYQMQNIDGKSAE